MFLTEFDEEKMKKQEREEACEEERVKWQMAVDEVLQLFIKSGKICKEDAEVFKSIYRDKLLHSEIA